MRFADDEAFHFERLERLAHRRDRYAELGGDIRLLQLVAARVLTRDDPFSQTFCHVIEFCEESHDCPEKVRLRFGPAD
jgi:hypothetical protein